MSINTHCKICLSVLIGIGHWSRESFYDLYNLGRISLALCCNLVFISFNRFYVEPHIEVNVSSLEVKSRSIFHEYPRLTFDVLFWNEGLEDAVIEVLMAMENNRSANPNVIQVIEVLMATLYWKCPLIRDLANSLPHPM